MKTCAGILSLTVVLIAFSAGSLRADDNDNVPGVLITSPTDPNHHTSVFAPVPPATFSSPTLYMPPYDSGSTSVPDLQLPGENNLIANPPAISSSPPPNTQTNQEQAATPSPSEDGKSANTAGTTKSAENKKHKKHKKIASKPKKLPSYSIKDRLPEEIYKKSYDIYNKHLPVAYYEQDYDNLLFITAMHDDINGLRSLILQGRNINKVDENGDTPLLVAVKNDSINTALLLIRHNAGTSITDSSGKTPLQVASAMGNERMVGLLSGFPQ